MSREDVHHGARRRFLIGWAATTGVLAVWCALRPPAEPGRFAVALVAVEAVVLAIIVPFAAARSRHLLGQVLPVACIAAAALLLTGIACGARGPNWAPWARVAWAQPFLAAWAGVLARAAALLQGCGTSRSLSHLSVTLLAFAMIATPFYANWFVETASLPSLRRAIAGVVLWANPWLIAGGSILEADPIRTKNLYDLSTVHLYGFQYPASGIPSLWLRAVVLTAIYGGAAGALHALAFAVSRRRRRAAGDAPGDAPPAQ